jgi:flagellar FliJ protein
MTAAGDAGMRAVARVRGVREQDSRIGLQQALAEQRLHESRAADLRHRVENAGAFAGGSVASYVALRASLDALSHVLLAAEEDTATSRTISESAYVRWQHDKTRLSAVEVLLERRAAERRAQVSRREARELDEVAVQLWQRRESGRRADAQRGRA